MPTSEQLLDQALLVQLRQESYIKLKKAGVPETLIPDCLSFLSIPITPFFAAWYELMTNNKLLFKVTVRTMRQHGFIIQNPAYYWGSRFATGSPPPIPLLFVIGEDGEIRLPTYAQQEKL